MVGSIAAWTGWSKLKASLRWLVPVAAIAAVIVGFWILFVSPRLELRQMELDAQADQLQRTEDALTTLQGQVAAQREIDTEKTAATDEAAMIRSERIERTTVIREAAAARAEANGDPEIGAGLDAFLADLRKEQGK